MQFSAEVIASLIGGTIEGDKNAAVSDFSKIETARPGTITFLANPKYTHYIYTTDASIVLVNNDFVAEAPVKATLIRCANPYEALAELLNMAAKALKPDPQGIEQPVHISEGSDTEGASYIGAFAYIGRGVKLGKNVKIYPQAYIGDGEIGRAHV